MSVYRVYVEKKAPFAVEAQGVLSDIHSSLGIGGVTGVRILNRYDVEDITPEDFELAKKTILSEPQVDEVYDELPAFGAQDKVFAVQFLPGQFDQRADSAVQCIQLATQHDRPTVASAKVYVISGASDEELSRIKKNLINPVESMESPLEPVQTLHTPFDVPADVAVLEDFNNLDQKGLEQFIAHYGLAMDLGDITFCQQYFQRDRKTRPDHHRDPHDRHLLVRPLPPHHLLHPHRGRGDRERLCQGRLQRISRAAQDRPRGQGQADDPDGPGHHRRQSPQEDRACSRTWTSPRRSTPARSRSRSTSTARSEDWLLHV